MKKLTFLIITLLVVAIQSANCQVETKYYPDGKALQSVPILAGAKASGKMEIMPSFDVGKLIEEDKLNEGLPVPYRFGNGFDVCISLEDGTWTKVENGRLWSMTFHSKGHIL